ncbi:hypothetical protein CALK_0021 [Chitinivibrio alkaliphilus ACht1]|uniref:Uncharacterized protein n=1 Tax=Chitinivibrio alkaliphilus ACht1 TaxID=1313304 RepID=U7D8E5_9BACT|nr:hypothetical protein CALK_0021 [Chitinivibrio alkaliphilus ACht1]
MDTLLLKRYRGGTIFSFPVQRALYAQRKKGLILFFTVSRSTS